MRFKILKMLKRYKNHIIALIICCIIAAVLTHISYPGFYFSDSYSRIGIAKYIADYKFSGMYHLEDVYVQLMPTFIMSFFYKYNIDIGWYTTLCAASYFFITYILINYLNAPYKWLQYCFFLINPVLLFSSVWDVPDLMGSVGLGLILILLTKNKFFKIDYLLLFISSVLIFGYRVNAYVILPLIFFLIVKNKNTIKTEKLFQCSIISIAIILNLLLPIIYKIEKMPIAVGGFVWETLNVIKQIPGDSSKYNNYLDDVISKKGATERGLWAIEKDDSSLNEFFWDYRDDLTIFNLQKGDNTKKAMQKFFNIVKENPKTYTKVKLYYICRIMGIFKPLEVKEIYYDRWKRMYKFHFKDSYERRVAYDLFIRGANYNLIRFPWVLFLLTLFLFVLQKKQPDKKLSIFYIFAFLYYASFFITTHSFEIRYFFPSYYLLCIINVSMFLELFKQNLLKRE